VVKVDIRKLWARVVSGDHKAWQQLVRQYAALVYTVARRAGLSQPDAEDCAQHAWLALYRRRRSIKNPAAVPAWLVRTAHREAVKMARHLRTTSPVNNELEGSDPSSLPDELLDSLEFQIALGKAVDRLDPRCRTLITELYLSGEEKKYKEIAALLGVKPNSFGPLRSRCLERLRENLKKLGYQLD